MPNTAFLHQARDPPPQDLRGAFSEAENASSPRPRITRSSRDDRDAPTTLDGFGLDRLPQTAGFQAFSLLDAPGPCHQT